MYYLYTIWNVKYSRLPMGLKCSPDFTQSAMENVLHAIEEFDVYIDGVGIFTNSWGDHIKSLDAILQQLRENGFTTNPLKCGWAVKGTDWLGYWLKPRVLKPQIKISTPSCTWIGLVRQLILEFSLVVSITTDICGQFAHIF